jgi:hypothetical protein
MAVCSQIYPSLSTDPQRNETLTERTVLRTGKKWQQVAHHLDPHAEVPRVVAVAGLVLELLGALLEEPR